jgi:hypothetical protein
MQQTNAAKTANRVNFIVRPPSHQFFRAKSAPARRSPSRAPVRADRRRRKSCRPRDQGRRAGRAEVFGERAFGLQALLDGAVSRARQRGLGLDPDFVQRGRGGRGFADRPAFGELGAINGARESGAAFPFERDARGEKTALRERVGPPQGQPESAADALHVAPHIAAPGRIDVERRIAPALLGEQRAERERAPAHRRAARRGERLDAHRSGIGIGAGELAPEIDLRDGVLLLR